LNGAQGPAVDLGGYYRLDAAKAEQAMRPSATLNQFVIG
jgi:isocitrate dehydrogenase